MAYDRKDDDSTVPRSVFWLFALWVILVLAALVWGVDNAEATLGESARRSLAADGHAVVVDCEADGTRTRNHWIASTKKRGSQSSAGGFVYRRVGYRS